MSFYRNLKQSFLITIVVILLTSFGFGFQIQGISLIQKEILNFEKFLKDDVNNNINDYIDNYQISRIDNFLLDNAELNLNQSNLESLNHSQDTTNTQIQIEKEKINLNSEVNIKPAIKESSQNQNNIDEIRNQNYGQVNLIYEPKEILPASEKIVENTNSNEIFLTGFSSSNFLTSSTGVSVNEPFTLEFPIAPSQDFQNKVFPFLKFTPDINFTYQLNGKFLTVYPEKLKRYTNYSFGFFAPELCTAKLENNNCGPISEYCNEFSSDLICETDHDVYFTSFRTDFKEVVSIGKSVEGRDIPAYIYGKDGADGKVIMLSGGVHGDEWRAGGLENFVSWMSLNGEEIVNQDKTLIIVPVVNVDGKAINIQYPVSERRGRYNARGVNLNRNWPASWKPCDICGSGPASEPEVSQLLDFKLKEKVTHLITYHAQWPPFGIIFLGDNSNPVTRNFAQWVADRTGYPLGIYDGPETGGGDEDVPGDQAVWGESAGIRSLLIEATYVQNDDYISHNLNLYLALLRDF